MNNNLTLTHKDETNTYVLTDNLTKTEYIALEICISLGKECRIKIAAPLDTTGADAFLKGWLSFMGGQEDDSTIASTLQAYSVFDYDGFELNMEVNVVTADKISRFMSKSIVKVLPVSRGSSVYNTYDAISSFIKSEIIRPEYIKSKTIR